MTASPEPQPKQDIPTQQAELEATKTSTSRGEKLFDLLTYAGIGGVGTFVSTIPIAYWAKYGGGAKGFASAAHYLTHKGMSARAAEDALMATATMQGGNLTLAPIRLVEHYKPQLVEKLNSMVGDKSGDASTDKDSQQTAGSLIKSRFAAWITVFTGFRGASMVLGTEKFVAFEDAFSKHIICAPFKKPTHTPGLAKVVANETKFFRYGKIAAIDVFATTAATSLLYLGSRFFARNNEKWHAHDLPETSDTTPAPVNQDPLIAATPVVPSRRFSESFTQQKAPAASFADAIIRQKAAVAVPALST